MLSRKRLTTWISAGLAALLLAGCSMLPGGSDRPEEAVLPGEGEDPLTGIAYAADTVYSYLYDEELSSLNYLKAFTAEEKRAAANFADGLTEYDADGNVVPCLAESWEVSEDGLTWTFHLREDAFWVDCDGNEAAPVTAGDFVFGARLVADPDFGVREPEMLISYVEGAIELYNKEETDPETLGVKAKDDHTLVYRLQQPCPFFPALVTDSCFLPVREAFYEALPEGTFGTARDKLLYCGAYTCADWTKGIGFTWAKNEAYWDAANVHVTAVEGTFDERAQANGPALYMEGKVDACSLSGDTLTAWMEDDKVKYVHPTEPMGAVMYLLFDFAPAFDDEAASEAYRAAVNNKDFRKSLFYGLDRKASIVAYDRYAPEQAARSRMTPAYFARTAGKDYEEIGEAASYTADAFDGTKALEYKAKAAAALREAGVSLPIRIPLYRDPREAGQQEAFGLLETQLEGLLGTDYIDIEVLEGPSAEFIARIRRTGRWGLYEAGWIPDYPDPAACFEPFGYGWSFGFLEKIEGEAYRTGKKYREYDLLTGLITDEALVGEPQTVFMSLVEKAKAETEDPVKRAELFSRAEAYALEEALFLPYRQVNEGYAASNLTVFDGERAVCGLCGYKLKGRHLLVKSYDLEEYGTAEAAWRAARS